MPNLTIYVREEDLPVFERAKEMARSDPEARGLSQMIADALKERLADHGQFRPVVLLIGEDLSEDNHGTYGTYRQVRFMGRLIAQSRQWRDDVTAPADGWLFYATPKGWIVIVREHQWIDTMDLQVGLVSVSRRYWKVANVEELRSLKDGDGRPLLDGRQIDVVTEALADAVELDV
jgi:hypothetical protein